MISLIQNFEADFLWKVSLKIPEFRNNPEKVSPMPTEHTKKTLSRLGGDQAEPILHLVHTHFVRFGMTCHGLFYECSQ